MTPLAERLPEFPWDRLAPFAEIARSHTDGVIDLSIGTPVDPVPDLIQAALVQGANAPGYPLTAGTMDLRAAVVAWAARTLGAAVPLSGVLPTIGSKELVSLLPTLLGLSRGDVVAIPEIAYPTYDVGAQIAGCTVLASDSIADWERAGAALVWLNSPSNPSGRVLGADQLATIVDWARAHDVIVASDECYFELGWSVQPVSILDPAVCGDSLAGVLAVHSLSKRSNLAGYRTGFVLGDPGLVQPLLEARKHIGLMVPAPIQAAAIAALGDDSHVRAQRERYQVRRDLLWTALASAGFAIEHSDAGLYLWATRGESCWDSLRWLADHGILAAPGEFYGASGNQHVRVALTATDERIAAAVRRLQPA